MRPDASTKLQSVAPKQGPSKGLIAAIVGLVAVIAIAASSTLSATPSRARRRTRRSAAGLGAWIFGGITGSGRGVPRCGFRATLL